MKQHIPIPAHMFPGNLDLSNIFFPKKSTKHVLNNVLTYINFGMVYFWIFYDYFSKNNDFDNFKNATLFLTVLIVHIQFIITTF